MPLPSVNVPVERIKFRFGEKYISEAMNQKFLGVPNGVYSGFIPSVDGYVITLSPDPVSGFSFARLISSVDNRESVDVFTQSALTLDLTDWVNSYILGVPGVVFPIFLFLTAEYQLGALSSAKIEFRNIASSSDTDLILGQVFYDGTNLTVSATLPLERANPYAYSNAPLGYGFMRDGDADGLLEGLDVTDEVIAARTDLAGTTWPSLADRLNFDFSGAAMASRLAKSVRVIQSNVHTLASAVSSINVSESFSEVTRQLDPILTIEGAGDETQVGAVTGPADAVRNVVFVVNDDTKDRPINNDIERYPIFGRLFYDETIITGTYTFTASDPNVSGSGTFFTVELEVGDLILAPDGLYYAVQTITDNENLVLTTNFGGAAGPISNGIRRRFTLNFLLSDGLNETAATLPAGDIRFFFGAFFALDTPVFDASLVMHQDGEPVRIGNATVDVSGRVIVDSNTDLIPVPLAGSVQTIKDGGFDVAKNVYDINFDGAVPGASPGVVDITQRGPTGPTGPDGTGLPGPTGPTGPSGIGFNGGTNQGSNGNNHFWIKRSVFRHTLVSPNTPYFHTVNSNAYNIDEVLWATAGIWYIEDWGGGGRDVGENWWLTNVTRDTDTQVTLTARTEEVGAQAVDIGLALNIAGRT